MKKFLLFLCILSLGLAGGCSSPETPVSGKVNVYTSFYAMSDFVRQIGGDHVSVTTLVPSGVEPHDWEPSPSDLVKLEKGDVFVYNGHHMESWTDKVLSSISNPDLIIVETAKKIPESTDPHVWLNPDNALLQMEAIRTALCEKDPANSEYYNRNYETCKAKIEALDNAYTSAVNQFQKKEFIVAHEAYGYLCEKYGLRQVAVEGIQGDADPSPARMAEIVSFARENNIKYIFFENLIDTKVLDTIKNEIGAQALILNPFESDNQENKDYFTVMEENLDALKTALL